MKEQKWIFSPRTLKAERELSLKGHLRHTGRPYFKTNKPTNNKNESLNISCVKQLILAYWYLKWSYSLSSCSLRARTSSDYGLCSRERVSSSNPHSAHRREFVCSPALLRMNCSLWPWFLLETFFFGSPQGGHSGMLPRLRIKGTFTNCFGWIMNQMFS